MPLQQETSCVQLDHQVLAFPAARICDDVLDVADRYLFLRLCCVGASADVLSHVSFPEARRLAVASFQTVLHDNSMFKIVRRAAVVRAG